MQQPRKMGGWKPDVHDFSERIREAKMCNLSPTAQPFVPKSHQNPVVASQEGPYAAPGHYQSQMEIHQSQPSLVQHRFAAAQGSVEPGGGGGGAFDYQQMGGPSSQHHIGNNNGAMANGSNDPCKVSALQNRLSNVRIGVGGGGGGMSRGDNNGKDFNHHQQHQHPMQQHHQQQRVQQQPYQQHQGHHGHHHHQHHTQQAQVHQPYPYGVAYSNASTNYLNHPILGAANHHLGGGGGGGGGGGMSDNRKHNNSGGQQHHRSRQQHPHQHHQHHHQHHHGSHHHLGGGGGGAVGHGMMADGNMQPMAGVGGNSGSHMVAVGGYDEQTTGKQSVVLDYLTEVIAELFDNPGMFEDVKEKLSNMFAEFRHDGYVLSNAVEMIFEQSIKESNFRYMGARLCKLLDSLDDSAESMMRVLVRLKMEYQQSELPNFMNQEQVKVRGTTLFLAELYMQLRSAQDDLGEDIAKHIIDAIRILLRKEGPENLKCVCQCLKLCGFELEQDCRDDVHNILGTLENLQSSIQSSVGSLIKSVLDLHSKSWGRSEEVAAIVPVAPAIPNPPMSGGMLEMGVPGNVLEFADSPVFYGPDGEVLTEEENSFLETNNKQNPGYNDDDEDVFDDTDPEMHLAYKDFLQSSNATNRQPEADTESHLVYQEFLPSSNTANRQQH